MTNILVVLAYDQYPMKATIWDHLHAFEEVKGTNVVYVNLVTQRLDQALASLPFDLIVFHYTFFAQRFRGRFEKFEAKAGPLKTNPAVKVIVPQDDSFNTQTLWTFIADFDVSVVVSSHCEESWPTLYAPVDRDRITMVEAFPGYLSASRVATIEQLAGQERTRDIDVGYRSWQVAPWLGRHGMLKAQIADVFAEHAPRFGLRTDISLEPKDVFLGDDWYRFMARCKYMIGVEGGVSMIDPDGSIRENVNAYVAAHPAAGFDEVEAACFPGLDGKLPGKAISPRHLECCATHTCQVLVEGDYGGVLNPWEHYIPVKADFSDLDDVLRLMKEDQLREEITSRAYSDVVESGAYTYSGFARLVLDKSLRGHSAGKILPEALLARHRRRYRRGWVKAWWWHRVCRPPLELLARVLPQKVTQRLKKLLGKG